MTRRDAARDRLRKALGERRLLVVCGAGGVGKTTTAAALALRAALLGRRALVCTIDPARRLATSLGLSELSERPRRLSLARLRLGEGTGELHAMMLDTKRTFDALVERYARDQAARRRILDNRFYREVSSALAGSQEYMAMEKVLELWDDDRFDLVVLDTPPTRHALDFLEAPDRLLGFLDASVLRYVLRPYFAAGKLTLKVASRTGAALLRLADRVLGLSFLQDLSEFFLSFESMYDGFKERAAAVNERLRSPAAGFVLVAAPSEATLQEALHFHRRLEDKRMPFAALIVNRMHPEPAPRPRGPRAVPAPVLDAELRKRLGAVHDDYRRLAQGERRAVSRLEVDTGEAPVLVPEQDNDVHDLRGLLSVARALLPE
jgi:anion-transporting  ArsA/GET3 family ATPase